MACSRPGRPTPSRFAFWGTLQPDDIAGAHAVNWSGPSGEVALTVVRAGAGTGTVTSIPAGIACGTMCTAQYPNGTGPDLVNGFGGAGGAVLVGGTGLTVNVPAGIAPGTHEVRVIGVSTDGQPLGTFSDAVTLVIE